MFVDTDDCLNHLLLYIVTEIYHLLPENDNYYICDTLSIRKDLTCNYTSNPYMYVIISSNHSSCVTDVSLHHTI